MHGDALTAPRVDGVAFCVDVSLVWSSRAMRKKAYTSAALALAMMNPSCVCERWLCSCIHERDDTLHPDCCPQSVPYCP